MIFNRAAMREFAHAFAAVFVALFAIMLTNQLIRLLGQAAGGKIAPEAVLALVGFGTLQFLPAILALTLFIAIMLSLSRVWRDSEMVIWFSSGISLTAWLKPVLRFSMPVVVAIAVLSFFLTPWALNGRSEYKNATDEKDDISKVSPGAFKESGSADKVFFMEAVLDADGNDTGRVKNIFVNSMQDGKLGVMVASTGHSKVAENGDRFLVLEKGRRYQGTPGQDEYRVMNFERYAIRIESKEVRGVDEVNPSSLPVWELLANKNTANLGELLWRIGTPLVALVLALLAIPLSFINPRAGRTYNMILAIVAFMLYNNLLNISRVMVAQGKLQFGVAVWAVHVLMLALVFALFYYRIGPKIRRI